MSACLCTGVCLNGGQCAAYPQGRLSGCYGGHSTLTPPTFGEIQNFKNKINLDVESIRQQTTSIRDQVVSQEETINHTQEGIELCFQALERYGLSRGLPGDKIPNPFEYIAVDAKRRDDMNYIKNSLYDFYCWIVNTIQDNKERSKGIERLEDAAMWLNKSISRRKDNETRNDRQPKSKR